MGIKSAYICPAHANQAVATKEFMTKKKECKTEMVKLRVSPTEKILLLAQAKYKDMTFSKYVRRKLLKV